MATHFRMDMIKKIINRLNSIRYHIKYQKAIAGKSVEERFTNIYKENIWFRNKESKSGAGSTLAATVHLRKMLPTLLAQVNATLLVDIGCGDFYWMKEVNLPCPYLGLDIVKSLIEENRERYGNEKREFRHFNGVQQALPNGSDFVLCREVLFHLSFKDGQKVIQHILDSEARYFMTTTNEETRQNKDIESGQFRGINLLLPPYNFPPYEQKVEDNAVSADRVLGLWKVEDLRRHLTR